MKYYFCERCGVILGASDERDIHLTCCGQPMQELVANTVEASVEKHMPVVNVSGNIVEVVVGSTLHPMTEEHHIAWVSIQTKEGRQRKALDVTGQPCVKFALTEGDSLISVFAYCNLHGLWRYDA